MQRTLVVVYYGGKPIQSFRFRFTDYKEPSFVYCLTGTEVRTEAYEQIVPLQVRASSLDPKLV